MTFWEFLDSSPILAFSLAALLVGLLTSLIKISFRHMNIRKHGWPPEHCDADGDFKSNDEAT